MTEYRKPTPAEIEALTAAGNSAENWDAIEVAQDFTPAQLSGCRLEGRVQIGRGARLRRCTIRNYRIGEEALIEGVTALECRRELLVRQRSPGRRHQRERRTYRTDLRPTLFL